MKHKAGIITLVFLVCLIGAVTGYKYYNYMKTDPGYCSVCHMMKEGYESHDKSSHYDLLCQYCHKVSVMEGNKLLLAYFVKGSKDIKQTHGRLTPWDTCIGCHGREAEQGSITLKDSYGHARHIFMQNIKCGECHSGRLHVMKADAQKCQKCHVGKLVHGMGTTGLFCLNCHNFAEPTFSKVSPERCLKCHKNLPTKGIMSRLACHECHHPHATLKFDDKDCLGSCHSSETRVGEHKRHMEKSRLGCLSCHKPHVWSVGAREARVLCTKCHGYKDPLKFIY